MLKTIKFSSSTARKILPQRKSSANKSQSGKCLIIAGSKGMMGAGVLSATAAARVGAGYTTLMTDLSQFSLLRSPDFLSLDRKKKISHINYTSIAIGPGLGQSKQSLKILKDLLKKDLDNVVVDADALNLLSKEKPRRLPPSWILTPHEGELARLMKISADQIRLHRLKAVIEAQKKWGCIIVLKGHHTLVATGRDVYEIQSGNAALAKAGTGDVLTGIITGLLTQGLSAQEAACLGCFIHGKIADDWIKSGRDILSLMASDLLNEMPKTIFRIRNIEKTALS